MNLVDGRGVYSVVYRDNMLTEFDRRIITTAHCQLEDLAKKLGREYRRHFVSGEEPNLDYLISGVLIKTNSVAEPRTFVDEVTLVGETKAGIELLAERLGLPEIPDQSFVAYHS